MLKIFGTSEDRFIESATKTSAPSIALPITPATPSPLENMFTTNVSRHDHHNLEIKAIFETGGKAFEGELNAYLFVPRSFDLRSWSKLDLERDVRTRLRLSIPTGGEYGWTALASARQAFKAAVHEFVQYSGADASAAETALLDTAREVCGTVAETLKQWTAAQTRALMMAHTVFATEASCLSELENERQSLIRAAELIEEIRTTGLIAGKRSSLLRSFDEYLSHLFVQYLGSIRSELDRHQEPPPAATLEKYFEVRDELDNSLGQIASHEAHFRKACGWIKDETESEVAREQRVLRMSHLKKFFQSRSFVEVSRRPSLKRISESTAFAGTALAGLVYAFLLRFQSSLLAVPSAVFISFGVAAYVVRDRLKDWAKERFSREASKFLADYEQVLIARDKKIGEVKEWFDMREASLLPQAVQDIRRAAAAGEIELRLPEDVFHYRKTQTITCDPTDQEGRMAVRALHESIRLNFERYLKHMDDPFKEHLELDHDGVFRRSRSHRVYHFYLAIEAKCRHFRRRNFKKVLTEASQVRLHRIVLDKNGIVRIESVEK